jgi:hypothetical protein
LYGQSAKFMPKQDSWWKPGQSGNPKGRRRKAKEIVIVNAGDDSNAQVLSELLRIAKDDQLAPTARVSAINSYLNRAEGLPNKAKPTGDEITQSTAQKLCELAEEFRRCYERQCPHCKAHYQETGAGNLLVDVAGRPVRLESCVIERTQPFTREFETPMPTAPLDEKSSASVTLSDSEGK